MSNIIGTKIQDYVLALLSLSNGHYIFAWKQIIVLFSCTTWFFTIFKIVLKNLPDLLTEIKPLFIYLLKKQFKYLKAILLKPIKLKQTKTVL